MIFINYRKHDTQAVVDHLAFRLKAHFGESEVFKDDTDIRGGELWPDRLRKELLSRRILIAVIGCQWLSAVNQNGLHRLSDPEDWVRQEICTAMEQDKSVLTILVDGARMPRIEELPDGPLRNLPALQAMPLRFGNDFDSDLSKLLARLDQLLNSEVFGSPSIKRSTKRFISADKPEPIVSIIHLPITGEVFGREDDFCKLDEAWAAQNCNVFTVVAWGGVGKSALVNAWRARMAVDHWRGAERVFGWTFYSQGLRDTASSAAPFIDAALRWFDDPDPALGTESEKGQRLAELVRQQRTLLLLDGLEPLQYSPGPQGGRLKDLSLKVLIEGLADHNPGLCVITTRYQIDNLSMFLGKTVRSLPLQTLTDEAGSKLLQTIIDKPVDEVALRQASRDFGGHALALNLLGTYVRDRWAGDIVRCLKLGDIQPRAIRKLEVSLLEAEQGYHADRVMASYERWLGAGAEIAVLRLVGLFDRIASGEEITVLRRAPVIPKLTDLLVDMTRGAWREVIVRLRRARLLSLPESEGSEALDAHPLVREYFGRQLRAEAPSAWQAAHFRLFGYLQDIAEPLPTTLSGLMPLYEAINHGCYAAKPQEALDLVYRQRILRKDMFSTRKLGALGADFAALYSFFEVPFRQLVSGLDTSSEIFILQQTGYCLRGQGRLDDALECWDIALRNLEGQGEKTNAAVLAGLMSQTHLTAGKLREAISYGERGVQLADAGADLFDRVKQRSALAYMKQQCGDTQGAKAGFQSAFELWPEAREVKSDDMTVTELLTMFHYGDFLIGSGKENRAIEELNDVLDRYSDCSNSRQAVALVQLIIGRAWLNKALMGDHVAVEKAGMTLQAACIGIREANREDALPLVLVRWARYCQFVGDFVGAWEAIRETFRILEHGGGNLYKADVHLASAWTYLGESQGSDEALLNARKHLETARRLVVKMKYHCRDEEIDELNKQC